MGKIAKRTAAAAAAFVLVAALGTAVGATGAYFTTHAAAKGSIEISLDEKTSVEESFGSWTKHVTISNDVDAAGSRAVFVRAKAFSGTTYPLTYSGDSNWSPNDDGYYYYATPLNPGEKTSVLDVKISGVPESDKANIGDSFNVVVVYETTPVLYDEDGKPYADWSTILDNGNLKGGE